MKDKENSFDFVISHFTPGAFPRRNGDWASPRKTIGIMVWMRRHAAAAVFSGIVLLASAFTAWIALSPGESKPVREQQGTPVETATLPIESDMKIDFEDVPVADIVSSIESTYGVELKNVPDTDKRLTVCFEGNCRELIDMINLLLGSDIQL